MKKKKKVLFVCTGNSCRSVMADYYLRKRIAELNLKDIDVASVGVSAVTGMTASAETQMLLEDAGISAIKHKAKQMTNQDIDDSDIILPLEEYHRKHILSLDPGAENKVHLLKEFGLLSFDKRQNYDISDPIGQSMSFYEKCFGEVKESVERLIKVLELTIALGADHGGFEFKENLKELLLKGGFAVRDFGTHSGESCDYPVIASKLARAVADGVCERGILVCKSGIGMTIAANKIPGIRAGVCDSAEVAKLSREHNDCNVLSFGADRVLRDPEARILDVWLTTEHAGDRHKRRVDQITALEKTKQPKTN